MINKSLPWTLVREWLPVSAASYWYSLLIENIYWGQPTVLVFGKRHLVPRKTVFIGDKGTSYTYSGQIHLAKGWPVWFLPLLHRVNSTSNEKFNGCLLNLYRNGLDKMGWHSDNEKELIPTKPISSLSLGKPRDFILKNIITKERISLSLGHGDLFIMNYPCQEDWVHSLPKRSGITKTRINLSFRCHS